MSRLATCCAVAVILAASATVATAVTHSKEPRVETKLELDSTLLTMKVPHTTSLRAGKTFTVLIHVGLRPGWYIFSATNNSDCLCGPVTLAIPPQLASDFEVVSFRESGTIRSWYDSNFLDTIRAHYIPFDVIAKIRVLRKMPAVLPFALRVRYMVADSNQCWPPRWFDVPMTILGQKPLKLRISENAEQKSGSYPYEIKRKLA